MSATERDVGESADSSANDSPSTQAWLLLAYRVPSDPTRLRARYGVG